MKDHQLPEIGDIVPRSFDAFLLNYLALDIEQMQPGDSYLIMCVCRNAEDIEQLWDSCLPDWPEDDPRWKTAEVAEYHGPLFHKAFRQTGVCSIEGDDKRIYTALANGGDLIPNADNFWNIHDQTLRGIITNPELD